MYASRSSRIEEPRYTRDELSLTLQRNPQMAEDATTMVISALRTIRTSTAVWQYAIRRLRTACLIIQRMVRRVSIGSKLAVQHSVNRWVANDMAVLARLEASGVTDGFGPESPFLFFETDTRYAVVNALYVEQRAGYRQRYRRWLHELRNMELELSMLKDDLALQRRRMMMTTSPNADPLKSVMDGEALSQHRRSLFAGSLSVGPNASTILMSQQQQQHGSPRSHRSNSVSTAVFGGNGSFGDFSSPRRKSSSSGEFSFSRSTSPAVSPRGAGVGGGRGGGGGGGGPAHSTSSPLSPLSGGGGGGGALTITAQRAAARNRKAAARALSTLRTLEERITRGYNSIYRHKLHVPRFEFTVDFKQLHSRAMTLYASDARQRVHGTMDGLGLASRHSEAVAISQRIASSHAALAASLPALVAQQSFMNSSAEGHAASFSVSRRGGGASLSASFAPHQSQSVGRNRSMSLSTTPRKGGAAASTSTSAATAAVEALTESIRLGARGQGAALTTPRRRGSETGASSQTPKAAAPNFNAMAVALQKAFAQQAGFKKEERDMRQARARALTPRGVGGGEDGGPPLQPVPTAPASRVQSGSRRTSSRGSGMGGSAAPALMGSVKAPIATDFDEFVRDDEDASDDDDDEDGSTLGPDHHVHRSSMRIPAPPPVEAGSRQGGGKREGEEAAVATPRNIVVQCGQTVLRLATTPDDFTRARRRSSSASAPAFLTETDTEFAGGGAGQLPLPTSEAELRERGNGYLHALGIYVDDGLGGDGRTLTGGRGMRGRDLTRGVGGAPNTTVRTLMTGDGEGCLASPVPVMTGDTDADAVVDLEEAMREERRAKGQGGRGGGFAWSEGISKGGGGAATSRPVSKLPHLLQANFNARRTEVPTRAASPRHFEGYFIPPTHSLPHIKDEEVMLLEERRAAHRERAKSARHMALMEGSLGSSGGIPMGRRGVGISGATMNRAAAIRVQSARARISSVVEREAREATSDYVAAQDPRAKFVVPPRDERFTQEEMEALKGVYPFHRFYNVEHPTLEGGVGVGGEQHQQEASSPAGRQTIVAALFGGARYQRSLASDVRSGIDPPLPSDSYKGPRYVELDPSGNGKTIIKKHLLKHAYPAEYAAHQATLRHEEEMRLAAQSQDTLAYYNSARARRYGASSAAGTTRSGSPVASSSPRLDRGINTAAGGGGGVAIEPAPVTMDLMNRVMEAYDFSEATRMVVREAAADWQRDGEMGGIPSAVGGGGGGDASSSPFAGLDVNDSVAPFRRAPSSAGLKRPLSTIAATRNHNCGITAVTVIESINEVTTVVPSSSSSTSEKQQRSSSSPVHGGSKGANPSAAASSTTTTATTTTPSRHLIATGAFDGLLKIVSFPDLREVCHRQLGKGMITNMQVSRDCDTLCVAYDDGPVRLLRRRVARSWTSAWDLHATIEIERPAVMALSLALFGARHLIIGCYGGLLYVVPLDYSNHAGVSGSSLVATPHPPGTKPPRHHHSSRGSSLTGVASSSSPAAASGTAVGPSSTAAHFAANAPSSANNNANSSSSGNGVRLSIEEAATLKLETNVSGVSKLLSYCNEMIVTGGLDAQCNVIRMVYGEAEVKAMHERAVAMDAALSENIAQALGLEGAHAMPSSSAAAADHHRPSSETIDALLPASSASASSAVSRATRAFTVRSMQQQQRASVADAKSGGMAATALPSQRSTPPPPPPLFAVETARPFTCHTAAIVDLAHIPVNSRSSSSPNGGGGGGGGHLVCSASMDKTVCVWDALSFDLRYTFKLNAVLRAPLLVVPSAGGGIIVCPLESASIVALSSSSGTVVSESNPNTLRDPCVAGCLVVPPSASSPSSSAVADDDDGDGEASTAKSLCAFGTYGGRLLVFNPLTGAIVASKVAHTGAVLCMASCSTTGGRRDGGSGSGGGAAGETFLISCSDDRVTNFTTFAPALVEKKRATAGIAAK